MYYSNNIPNSYYNMYNYRNFRRPMPIGNRLVGGFALPFALGFLSGPLLLPPRPYPYYNYPIYY